MQQILAQLHGATKIGSKPVQDEDDEVQKRKQDNGR